MASLLESDEQPKVGKSARTTPPKGRDRAQPSLKGKTAELPIMLALTAKQEKFATLLAFGNLSQSDAYRQAYDAEGMTDKQVHEEASKLASSPKVRQWITQSKGLKAKVVSQDMESMRLLALDTLAVEAQGLGPDTKSSSRISAAVAIGKIRDIDLFADHKVVEHRDDSRVDALKSKLVQWLERMNSGNATALPRHVETVEVVETSVIGAGDPPPEGGPP